MVYDTTVLEVSTSVHADTATNVAVSAWTWQSLAVVLQLWSVDNFGNTLYEGANRSRPPCFSFYQIIQSYYAITTSLYFSYRGFLSYSMHSGWLPYDNDPKEFLFTFVFSGDHSGSSSHRLPCWLALLYVRSILQRVQKPYCSEYTLSTSCNSICWCSTIIGTRFLERDWWINRW